MAGHERIYISDTDRYVPLNISSSGQQESIRILQDLIYLNIQELPVTRIIEELETHLYPTAQKMLVEMIVYTALLTKSQFIITTHSPFVVAVFNNLLYLKKAVSSHPDKTEELSQHFGFNKTTKDYVGLDFDDIQAYSLKPGNMYCHSILDDDAKLIGENYIDKASEEIADDFDYIYSEM